MKILNVTLTLDKLEKRFGENMPPLLGLFYRTGLHVYARGLESDNADLNSPRYQWKNLLRRTKLELTTLMRHGKVDELEQLKKEYEKMMKQSFNSSSRII